MFGHLKKGMNYFKFIGDYFYNGVQARLLGSYSKTFFYLLVEHLKKFRVSLYAEGIHMTKVTEEKVEKLRNLTRGLYSLLPQDPRFTYSILVEVNQPRADFFEKSLESVLDQNDSSLEVLIGFAERPAGDVEEILSKMALRYPQQVRVFDYSGKENHESLINRLAEQAEGNYLFIMGQEDWIRPDLLFRYEQTMRIFSKPEKMVLYCNLNQINDRDYFIPRSEHEQPNHLHFPLFFQQFNEKGLMIPKALWKQVKGLQSTMKGAEYENLILQLDHAGAIFQHVPFPLYSIRTTKAGNLPNAKSQGAFIEALQSYTTDKKLDWEWTPGYRENSARAIPPLNPNHMIQAIIPYHNQKKLTLSCIQHLLDQKHVNFKITAIDNRSTDASIAKEIIALGGEVITIDEPFNYSRINNLAVQLTKSASECDILLFINNDVDLESDALSEMLRWIDQPGIGMVGCRLHYPDGRLQHGGVFLDRQRSGVMGWEHYDKRLYFEEMTISKCLGVCEGVTAACAMIKRETFLEVGGFDEIWYPIGYSDTNLAVKLKAKGLKCFYTPYAVGIHHESVSRKVSIEDYENSWWLHDLLLSRGMHRKEQ